MNFFTRPQLIEQHKTRSLLHKKPFSPEHIINCQPDPQDVKLKWLYVLAQHSQSAIPGKGNTDMPMCFLLSCLSFFPCDFSNKASFLTENVLKRFGSAGTWKAVGILFPQPAFSSLPYPVNYFSLNVYGPGWRMCQKISKAKYNWAKLVTGELEGVRK